VPVPGVPAPSDLVFLLQSDALQRVITYSSPTPLALPLAGLRIDASVGGALTLQQGTDTLAAQLLVVGHSGVGIVDHSGGIGSFADVVLGDQAGSSGFYTLRGTASLTASSTLMVGRNGWGIFVHHDSSQAVVGDLYLGVQRPGAGRL
jgi:T5SS/PEP-CTERM-associated repeat protein